MKIFLHPLTHFYHKSFEKISCSLQRPLFLNAVTWRTFSFRCHSEYTDGSAEENHQRSWLWRNRSPVPCETCWWEQSNYMWWLSDQWPVDFDCSSLLGDVIKLQFLRNMIVKYFFNINLLWLSPVMVEYKAIAFP